MTSEPRSRRLQRAFVAYKESASNEGEAERAISEYCRERHDQGASAEAVIIEIKHAALPILREDYGRLEKLVTKCIKSFYGAS